MPYNSWLTSWGQDQCQNLKTEMHFRLAEVVLKITGTETVNGRVVVKAEALKSADILSLLLRYVWVYYDATERKPLFYAKDVSDAMAKLILQSAGHSLEVVEQDYLTLDEDTVDKALYNYDIVSALCWGKYAGPVP